jgi:hypothetical protein
MPPLRLAGRRTQALALLVTLGFQTLFFAGTGRAVVHRVPEELPRISDALAAAAVGDTVLVAPGTYSSSQNGELFPLQISIDVRLIGAGMGVSVIDAEDQASVVEISALSGGRLSGFTITRGSAARGGGIHVMAGSPEIDRNLLIANGALNAGSGIYATGGAAPWIHHNVIWENYDLDLVDPGDPHGVQLVDAHGLFEQNLVGRTDSNGLFTVGSSNPVIRNNIFFENGIPGVRGRGICAFGAPTTVIAHNLFHGNAIAALLLPGPNGPVDVSAAEANALDPEDGIYGNLDGDPMFVDPDQRDWNLQPGSPAIDAGDPTAPLDPDGTIADIGPFYFDQSSTSVDPAGGRVPGVSLLSNTPNPFQLRTMFTYSLSAPARVRLAIYDLRGRLVSTLITNRASGRGTHSTSWDGRDTHGMRVASGTYFARLELGDEIQVRKLVLAE